MALISSLLLFVVVVFLSISFSFRSFTVSFPVVISSDFCLLHHGNTQKNIYMHVHVCVVESSFSAETAEPVCCTVLLVP